MSDRALALAACVLAFGLMVADSDDRPRLVISDLDSYHTAWDDPGFDNDLDDMESQLDELDADEESRPEYLHRNEQGRLSEDARTRLRERVHQLQERAREHRERVRAEWRAGFGEFRDAGRQMGEDFRTFGREMRDEGREIRNQAREIRQQARELRRQIREAVRQTTREKRSGWVRIELD
jgi:hypothetical protein